MSTKRSGAVSREFHEAKVEALERTVADLQSALRVQVNKVADKEAIIASLREDVRKLTEYRATLERDLYELDEASARRFKTLRAIAQMCEVGQ